MSSNQHPPNRSRALAIVLGFLLLLGVGSVVTVLLATGQHARTVAGAPGVLAALVAAGFGTRAALMTSGGMRFAWSMLAVYMLVYAGADALSAGILTGTPEVDLSDAVFMVAFVPAGLGLLFYPVLELVRGMWRPLLIDGALLIASATYVVHTLVLSRLHEADVDLLAAVIISVYPLLSTWCAALMLLVLARSSGERRPDAVLLGLAYVVFAVGDHGFVFQSTQGVDSTGTWVDACYTVAPLVLAAAAAVASVTPTPRRELRRHLSGGVTPVLADLFGLASLALAALIGPHDVASATLGLVTVLILGIRQVALTSASWRLRGALEARVEERTRELQEVTEHYERLDALKREFITMTSHELRTPLAAIRGGLEMLEEGDAGELNPIARKLVATASRGSERLSRLVNDILDLERLDRGVFGHSPRAQPMADLISEAAQALAPLAHQQHMSVRVDADDSQAWCEPDPIVQVLVNLLGNAFKFSEDGTEVLVRSRRVGDEVVVSVRDQGRGIPADQLETVFERFRQIEKDDSREKGGAGLGLSISHLIVQNHGGRIWADSDGDGNGSTFSFTLPAVTTSTEDAPVRTPVAV